MFLSFFFKDCSVGLFTQSICALVSETQMQYVERIGTRQERQKMDQVQNIGILIEAQESAFRAENQTPFLPSCEGTNRNPFLLPRLTLFKSLLSFFLQ